MPATPLDADAVGTAVRTVLAAESRLALPPEDLAGDEPLNGDLLRITSMGFLGMLMRLEDLLGITLGDDLFVGKSFTVVDDVVDAVLRSAT
jgi:acyl carrier protein